MAVLNDMVAESSLKQFGWDDEVLVDLLHAVD
jgi:hypothetical protein